MDATARQRILDRAQEEFDLEDITPETLDAWLNEPRTSEYGSSHHKTKTPQRGKAIGGSARRSAVFQDIGRIGNIYREGKEGKDIQSKLNSYLGKYDLSPENERLVKSEQYTSIAANARGDVGILKDAWNNAPPSARQYIQAQINNQFLYNSDSPIKEAFRSKDIGRLEQVRGELRGSGLPLEDKIVRQIDKYIKDIQTQKE